MADHPSCLLKGPIEGVGETEARTTPRTCTCSHASGRLRPLRVKFGNEARQGATTASCQKQTSLSTVAPAGGPSSVAAGDYLPRSPFAPSAPAHDPGLEAGDGEIEERRDG